ncbi:MAG: TetR-like C-terminal domain-containing protein, partial [Actinomycetota bacterium]
LGDAVADAAAGLAGKAALAALARASRAYVVAHPGRYTATIGAEFTGADDPLRAAAGRVIDLTAAVLQGYQIAEADLVPAIRAIRCTLHGFSMLQVTNAFQWSGDVDESFSTLIDFMDAGLRGVS